MAGLWCCPESSSSRARSPSQPHGLFAVTLLRWAGCWCVNNSLLRAPAALPYPNCNPPPNLYAPQCARGPGHAIIMSRGNKSCCTPARPRKNVRAHTCADAHAPLHSRAAPCQRAVFGVTDRGELPSTRVCKQARQPQAVHTPRL